MTDARPDTAIYPLLVELAACLQAEYGDKMPPVGIFGGQDVPIDLGEDCGIQGFVRVTAGYPSGDAFPTPDVGAKTCNSPLGFTVSVGVMRCAYEIASDGSVVVEEVNAFTAEQMADMSAMRRAIHCCLGDKFEDLLYTVLTWTPVEVSGLIGGGEWSLAVQELSML